MLCVFLCVFVSHGFAAKKTDAIDRYLGTKLLTPISTGEQIYTNPRDTCAQLQTCDLETIIFRKMEYVIALEQNPESDDSLIYGTKMFSGYVTERASDLPKYLFVQLTRGCMWYSYVDDAGVLRTEFGIVRGFLNRSRAQHHFPDWVIDSTDDDPAYSSDTETHNRHYYLQLSKEIPQWIPDRSGALYGEERAQIPFGYITDAPGPATYTPASGQATNMSLEYKTCLLKTSDVPIRVAGTALNVDNAVACFPWEAKRVYDHKRGEFTTHRGIHQECMRPFTPREEWFRKEH